MLISPRDASRGCPPLTRLPVSRLPVSRLPLPGLLAAPSVPFILVLPEHRPNQGRAAWTPRSTGHRQQSKGSHDRVSCRRFRVGSESFGSQRQRPPRRIRRRRSCVGRDGGVSRGTTSAAHVPLSSSCGRSRSCRPRSARCAVPLPFSARRGNVVSTRSARGMPSTLPWPARKPVMSTTVRGPCSETLSRRQ